MNNIFNDCGCCEGLTQETPDLVYNRPGLSAIAYRVGIHPQFKDSLLAGISAVGLDLKTRENDDFAIALLDAWATVADILTFYQERIANESYLRTATERLSLLQLARLIGYELRPGVAASTYLTFTLEDAPGTPKKATIDIGTKVQSVPGPKEEPQTFETIEPIEAKAQWNSFKAITTQPQILDTNSQAVYLQGTNTGLKTGDSLLIVGRADKNNPASGRWDFRRISKVEPDSAKGYTKVTWQQKLERLPLDPSIQIADKEIKVYAMRQRVSLFGYNAPDWRTLTKEVRNRYGSDSSTDSEWPNFSIAAISDTSSTASASTPTGLYGEYYDNIDLTNFKIARIDATVNFNWGSGSPDPTIAADTFSVRWTGQVQPRFSQSYTFYTQSDDGVRLWVNNQKIIDNWTAHVPTENSGTIFLFAGQKYDIKLEYYENGGSAIIQLFWSSFSQPKQIIPQTQLYPPQIDTIYLDAVYQQILVNSWVVLSVPGTQEIYQVESVTEASRKNFALTAKTTRLKLKGKNLLQFNYQVRTTVVFAQSEPLELAQLPLTSPITANTNSITLDRKLDPLNEPIPGQLLIVSGQTSDSEDFPQFVSEVVTLLKTELEDEVTKLTFQSGLINSYKRDTVIIQGNVARATHGETKAEILGSGNASQPYQRFTLRNAPLTYISASTPSGTESTLKVRVDDILWHEVATLYGKGSKERIYVTRIDDDGKTTIQFGDGKQGARLPTGQENVKATYRKGIGVAGLVKAEQLSLLMTRPLGVKGVINPLPATGAGEPETRDRARQNAPLTVLTLDRIVSLQDYEDFARAFAGIAKALATWTWNGQVRGVFVTVAGADGAEVKTESDLYKNLLKEMRKAGDPYIPLQVQSYIRAFFKITRSVEVDPDYISEKVLIAVEESLRSRFSFDARNLGQGVALSEVIAVMQATPGVIAVDIDQFYRIGDTPQPNSRLVAKAPQAGADGTVTAAELLTVNSKQ